MPFIEVEEEVEEELPPKGRFVEEKAPFAPGTAGIKGLLKGTLGLARSTPLIDISPIPKKLEERIIEKTFPTRGTQVEKGIERAGELIPLMAQGPAGIVRAIAGGISGQALEAAGAPEWAIQLAEMIPLGAPGLGKRIPPQKWQKEAVQFLRKKGLSEEAIAPLLKKEKTIKRLGKFAHKGQRTISRITEAHEKLGSGYSELKSLGQELSLPRTEVTKFQDALFNKLDDLSPDFKRLVEGNVEDLLKGEVNAKKMIDFWQDINNKISQSSRAGAKGGKDVLGILKEPVGDYFKKIDESLFKEFELLNKFYGKKNKLFQTLKPDQMSKFMDIAETLKVGESIVTGDLNKLEKTLGVIGARSLATELLINPRLQNLDQRMFSAIKKGDKALYHKLYQSFIKEAQQRIPGLEEDIKKLELTDEPHPSKTN